MELDSSIITNIIIAVKGNLITSTYDREELITDLNNRDIDKIASTLVKAYYDNDKEFKSTYITIIASMAIVCSLVWIWNKIKAIAPYVFLGIIGYYGIYRRGFAFLLSYF